MKPRFKNFFGLTVLVFLSLACISCASSPSTPDETAPDAVPVTVATLSASPEVVKPLQKKRSRKFRSDRGKLRSDEINAAPSEISVQCVVKLPDDSDEHPEICANFKIILIDNAGAEIARIRFDDMGKAQFPVDLSGTYSLKPLISKLWRFETEPKNALKPGDSVRAIFTQRE